MTLSTLFKYLIGDRDAILRVANCPPAIWIGLLFVIAAGFAREYDGEDLLHEPWHLLIPLGASVLSSIVLYALIRTIAWIRGATGPPLKSGYRSFLTLYWMTAPLALLYAVPFERFLSPADAMRANLFLLALVAGWRVLLITRVISVLYNCTFIGAFFPVMLFADSLVLTIVAYTPLPLLSIMGGIRLSESEMVLQSTTLAIAVLGFYSWPVWFLSTIGVAVWRESPWHYEHGVNGSANGISRPLWATAGASLCAWPLVLPFTQPEQILRRHVEADFEANRVREALLTMSVHEPCDFPPQWDPPPWLARGNPRPDIIETQETAESLELKPWVRQVYNEKFANSLRGRDWWVWQELSPSEVDRRLELVRRLPNRDEVVKDLAYSLEHLRERKELPTDTQTRIKELLEVAKKDSAAAQQNGEAKLDSASP